MNLLSQIESILFVASKPVTAKKMAQATGQDVVKIEEALETLRMKYNREDSGIHLLFTEDSVQMATNPENVTVIDGFIKDEIAGELTKAQLETLTVIAYHGPVTRPELEQIRGVNCAVIIRNLMIRGLVEEQVSSDSVLSRYVISTEALRHLGVASVEELPQYEELHRHEYIEAVLNGGTGESGEEEG